MTSKILQSVQSEDLVLGEVFNSFYVVPSYQREYVWGQVEVEQLLQDIYGEFASDPADSNSEYFIGSIIVFSRPSGVFELIDGQQRMTTALLILCAIRDHIENLTGRQGIAALPAQIAAPDIDASGRDVHRYRVELHYDDSRGVLEAIASGTFKETDLPAPTRSVKNIITSYQTIREFLKTEFGTDDTSVKRYYAYLMKNVKLVRIRTVSVAHALKVFETVNDRGVGLDSMDLLKNLMFMHTQSKDFDNLTEKWKFVIDTLFHAGEKPLRFLRYFVLAHYEVDRIREDEIYDWFVENEAVCGYRANSVGFVAELVAAARAYSRFIHGLDPTGKPNRYLKNIQFMASNARQHFIILLAARHLAPALFTELCRHIENLMFAYLITRESMRDFEGRFSMWARELRQIRNHEDLLASIDAHVIPAKRELSDRFELAFRELGETAIQKYRMRYILGKLSQFVNENAYGHSRGDADLANFINKRVDIEHILPKSPHRAHDHPFDRPDQIELYVQRLGNLALLEKSINASIQNEPYSVKRKAYRQSQFLLTKALGERISVGMITAIDRAAEDLEYFDVWDSHAIDRRQEMLLRLARRVWEIPTAESQ